MHERSLHLLSSPAFLLSLVLLLANDFILKQQFPNAITGKLSDVAGLFAFAVFWLAIFPRFRAHIIILTAAGFLFWKSPYSQGLIDGWNGVGPFSIGRVVDVTDLFALAVLPVANWYSARKRVREVRRPLIYAVAAISLFAFVATSYKKNDIPYDQVYSFSVKKKEFMQRMSNLPNEPSNQIVRSGEFFRVMFEDCVEDAWIGITETDGKTKVRLYSISSRCPGKNQANAQDELRTFFETNFVKPLEAPEVHSVAKLRTIREVKYADVLGKANRPAQ